MSLHVRVPTKIVRNEDFHLGNGEFQLYTRLCYLYFRNYGEEKLVFDHKKLMKNIMISDTRTLKKRLNNLYKCKLIKNEISKLPKSSNLTIEFNSEMLDSKYFTQMNMKLFDYIEEIDEHGFRLLFYYKSHINKKDKVCDRSFCYVGYETLSSNLKMSKKTIASANENLKKLKLLKIEKHKLENTFEYDENDEMKFDRYNNHYRLKDELF